MVFRTLRWKCALSMTVCMLVMGAASRAAADSITLEWDSSNSGLVGYTVHVGTESGSYTQHFDVGSGTLFTFPTAAAGQRYCFAVSAYLLSSQLEGPNSGEICGYSNAAPTLVNPGNRTSAVGQSVTLQLVGSDPASQPLTYSATGLPPGLSLMASTGFISGAGTTAGSYSVTVTASDGLLTASQNFTWTITTGPTGDVTPPTTNIGAPTSTSSYSTTSSTITLSGTASDNVGVTQVRWSNDRGGSGIASGTTSWTISGIPLLAGANFITVTAFDAAGNSGTKTLSVTYTTSSSDPTRPTVTIGYPSNPAPIYTTSEMSMSGTAVDDVGVTQVLWSNDRGGSGVANGTGGWSVSSLTLASGPNVITVTAVDAAGNQGTASITVTYSGTGGGGGGGGGGGSPDTTPPSASIGYPTGGSTYSTTSSTIALSGTASDNVGVTQVRWSSDRGDSGVAGGTTNWSISRIPLEAGSNVITITAVDAAGNPGTDYLTVVYGASSGGSDPTWPTVTIGYPSNPPVYRSPTMSMAGTASADVAVTQVRWSNDRGGSGVATGTGGWFVDSLSLASGLNVITVTAVDAAGNQGTTSITVTYTP